MKNFIAILGVLFFTSLPIVSLAQWINSLTVVPANPTTTDTVYVYADCSFPSGGCSQSTENMFVSPPVISANSLHCLGPLAVICSDTDIFVIPPLAAGPYTFIFQIDAGFGPAPCTPGIVPGPVDSVTFHVTQATSIPAIPAAQANISLVQGKNIRSFIVFIPGNFSLPLTLDLYSMNGQLLRQVNVTGRKQEIDLSFLDAGVYFIKQSGENTSGKGIKIILPQ